MMRNVTDNKPLVGCSEKHSVWGEVISGTADAKAVVTSADLLKEWPVLTSLIC